MTRLIDADATIYALNVASRGDSKDVIRNLVICFLLASPTVDAVPVIRCRNCRHRMHDRTCIKVMKRKPDDGFCNEGERNV